MGGLEERNDLAAVARLKLKKLLRCILTSIFLSVPFLLSERTAVTSAYSLDSTFLSPFSSSIGSSSMLDALDLDPDPDSDTDALEMTTGADYRSENSMNSKTSTTSASYC